MRVLIIGGGTAGLSTATRLRRLDENAEIVIFEKDKEFAVSNCGFTYYLSGIINNPQELIGASAESMRQMYNIDVRLNHDVTAINRREKTISIEGKDDEPYDKLVIAIGAYQLRPDIEGVLSDNIFTINNITSIEKIKDYIKYNDAKNILIIGGGPIGVEVAEALTLLKLNPVIIEASDHVVSAFDADMAAIIHNELRDKGIRLLLNDKVMRFEEKQAVLHSGLTLPYDMAIIATGVKPDVRLPVLAELDVGDSGGIRVNEFMQTSDKDIYAVGDTVEVINFITREKERISHAGVALRQARIAGDNLAGKSSKFSSIIPTLALKIFDTETCAAGVTETHLKKLKIPYQKIHLWAASSSGYFPGAAMMLFKMIFDNDGKILGIQGIGKSGIDKRLNVILSYIQNNKSIWELIDAEILYAPPFSLAKDAVNNLGSNAENILDGSEKLFFVGEADLDTPESEIVLIDVRPYEVFVKNHLPNAINLPMEAIRSNLDSVPHNKKVVLYCNHGRKSYLGSRILQNRGFDNIYVLSGGSALYNEIEKDKRIRDEIS